MHSSLRVRRGLKASARLPIHHASASAGIEMAYLHPSCVVSPQESPNINSLHAAATKVRCPTTGGYREGYSGVKAACGHLTAHVCADISTRCSQTGARGPPSGCITGYCNSHEAGTPRRCCGGQAASSSCSRYCPPRCRGTVPMLCQALCGLGT
jgi:hypothetical protein